MNPQRVADLTVDELQRMIRETVQQAVAEVMIEFAVTAQFDEQLAYEAEMNDLLRASLQRQALPSPDRPLDD